MLLGLIVSLGIRAYTTVFVKPAPPLLEVDTEVLFPFLPPSLSGDWLVCVLLHAERNILKSARSISGVRRSVMRT